MHSAQMTRTEVTSRRSASRIRQAQGHASPVGPEQTALGPTMATAQRAATRMKASKTVTSNPGVVNSRAGVSSLGFHPRSPDRRLLRNQQPLRGSFNHAAVPRQRLVT